MRLLIRITSEGKTRISDEMERQVWRYDRSMISGFCDFLMQPEFGPAASGLQEHGTDHQATAAPTP